MFIDHIGGTKFNEEGGADLEDRGIIQRTNDGQGDRIDGPEEICQ